MSEFPKLQTAQWTMRCSSCGDRVAEDASYYRYATGIVECVTCHEAADEELAATETEESDSGE